MKICVIRHGFYPGDSRVNKEVQALKNEEYQVDVICLKYERRKAYYEVIDGVKIYRIPLTRKRGTVFRYFYEYGLSFFLISILLCFLFFKNKYDFIQVNSMPDFLVFVSVIPKLCGAKVILDLHEPTPELWMTKYGEKRFKFFIKLQSKIEQMAIKFADLPLTVTKTLRRRFAKRGADLNKIVVVPNVCDDTIYNYNDFQGDQQKAKFIIFTHGSIEKRYGHEDMIRAVNSLKGKIENFQFNITGYGDYTERLIQLIEELRCQDIVNIFGLLPFDEFFKKLREATLGINAMLRNQYSELIDTNKMYEYMALKIPVITSRLAAIEENFDDNCLMYYEPGDYHDLARCILELYLNPKKREDIAENAYIRYQMIKWSKTKYKYLNAIKKL